ncbi:MFS transporter [Propionicicella superfundia]|uniref:MFS transporter n=1 Tax=Propionicicella superfundia TaxID=348582 RepID=UPI00041CA8DA|nr:MFS transporter [Propionicicella superfundia]
MTDSRLAAHPGVIVAILALTGVIATGIQTLVVPLIGQLPSILGATPADTSWVITATLLAAAVAVPLAGRLGDIWGKRPVLMASLLPLIAGTVVCALSSSLLPMILGRSLQGLGMGVVPLGISLLREIVPAERVGSAVATMSASMGIGGALGLPFAAVVGQTTSWRVMFWTFAGLALTALVLVWRCVPAGLPPQRTARFDGLGAGWLSFGLVCLLLGISRGAEWGWTSSLTLGLLWLAFLALALFSIRQVRTDQPLINVRGLADRRIALTNIASLLISFSTYALSYVVPQILQLPAATGYGLGQSMVAMALWLAPGGLAMLAVAPRSARLSARYGPKVTIVLGAVVSATGFASAVPLMATTWGILAVVVACNAGLGMAYAAIPLVIMDAVPPRETASANGVNTLARAIGTSTAGAVIGSLLAGLSSSVAGYTVPSLGGLHLVMLISAGAGLGAAILAIALPRRSRSAGTPPPVTTEPVLTGRG